MLQPAWQLATVATERALNTHCVRPLLSIYTIVMLNQTRRSETEPGASQSPEYQHSAASYDLLCVQLCDVYMYISGRFFVRRLPAIDKDYLPPLRNHGLFTGRFKQCRPAGGDQREKRIKHGRSRIECSCARSANRCTSRCIPRTKRHLTVFHALEILIHNLNRFLIEFKCHPSGI